jgi:hypothetical protein
MNATEERAYSWLLRTKMYPPDDIVFQSARSPDFLTRDGRGWEVKYVRNGTVTFYGTQLQQLREHPNVTVVCFDRRDEPVLVAPFADVSSLGYYRGLRFVEARNTIDVPMTPEQHRKIRRWAARQESTVSKAVLSAVLSLIDDQEGSEDAEGSPVVQRAPGTPVLRSPDDAA